MHIFIIIVHIVISLLLIFIVLLQTGKGSDMGAAFGGSSQTIFGSSGPMTFLGKMTTLIATVFMLTSLWLAYFAVHKTPSVIETSPIPGVEKTIPADQSNAKDVNKTGAPSAEAGTEKAK
ncbi:MAG: preprotein translocase subunit SecG [Deltaproteobacteria bacterium]|nr:preprotein translocase subunit SecG [Deltaproteobacteria bacterium]